ncbi:transposase [bacterium]|nr:transposase [bacterium]
MIIASYSRKHIFVKYIKHLRQAFKNVMQIYKFEIIAICVLPDHIHMILNPTNIEEYPKIISSIKHSFSKTVGQVCPTYNIKVGYTNKREKGIFQHRYYEHTITSQEELNKHIDYIHYNPVKHGYVKMAKDWEFSSFSKFVKDGFYDENWCDFREIEDIDYE